MARPQCSSVTPRRAAHAEPAKANVHEGYYFSSMGPNRAWRLHTVLKYQAAASPARPLCLRFNVAA